MEQREKVLVVDDDADACELISTVLGQLGFEIDIAVDGYEAMRKVRRASPDIVLTDLQMPGMNGIELIAALRQMHVGLPVILMTGADTHDLCTAAEAYGAVACLPKPINLDQLIWKIESTLACQGHSRGHFAAAV
jgi:CheY-like chemotaxis protein